MDDRGFVITAIFTAIVVLAIVSGVLVVKVSRGPDPDPYQPKEYRYDGARCFVVPAFNQISCIKE